MIEIADDFPELFGPTNNVIGANSALRWRKLRKLVAVKFFITIDLDGSAIWTWHIERADIWKSVQLL
jgi:hypothetical protein